VIVVRPTGTAEAIVTDTLHAYFNVIAETTDGAWARQQLRQRRVEAVILIPESPSAHLARGQQATIVFETNQIDPLRLAFLQADLKAQIADFNRQILTLGVQRATAATATADKRLEDSSARLIRIDQEANDPAALRPDVDALYDELAPTLEAIPALAAAAQAGTAFMPPEQRGPVSQELTQSIQTAAEARTTLEAMRAEAHSPRPSPARIRALAAVLRGQVDALEKQMSAIKAIPPQTIVEPFQGEIRQLAPYQPTLITFYAPAALALLLQHFAVTFAALSMVRARLLGMVEFWRIAPIRASEIVAGNYISYGLLSLAAWAVLTAAIVFFLGVPILGSLNDLVTSAVLLILGSLGIGFVISLLASSEQQAAQLAMLVLLGSVFLSGFVQPLESIQFPVRYSSFLLPATFGIQLFQDVMLRGIAGQSWYYGALAALSTIGLVLVIVLFRHELRPV